MRCYCHCFWPKECCRTDSMHINSESKVSATLPNKYVVYLLRRVADTLLSEFVCMESVRQQNFNTIQNFKDNTIQNKYKTLRKDSKLNTPVTFFLPQIAKKDQRALSSNTIQSKFRRLHVLKINSEVFISCI